MRCCPHFYETDWAAIPNLIMDLVIPPLVPWVGIYIAGRIFIGLTLLLLLLGPMVLHRAIYRNWSAWPLVGGLFVYNGFLFVGLMNYLFGVGVAVFGLAAWGSAGGKIRRPPSPGQHCILCGPVCLPFGRAGAVRPGNGQLRRVAAVGRKSLALTELVTSAAALALPFLPFLYILLCSPMWGLARDNLWESQGKLDAISLFLSVYSDLTDIPFLVFNCIRHRNRDSARPLCEFTLRA